MIVFTVLPLSYTVSVATGDNERHRTSREGHGDKVVDSTASGWCSIEQRFTTHDFPSLPAEARLPSFDSLTIRPNSVSTDSIHLIFFRSPIDLGRRRRDSLLTEGTAEPAKMRASRCGGGLALCARCSARQRGRGGAFRLTQARAARGPHILHFCWIRNEKSHNIATGCLERILIASTL